ncbi:hypothetical protein NDN08_007607 [Rhodosorus marinus]|uniref:Uncharacterized protein n=1 Tax=Rhodosorus marinus TaxID=101924 RepID=A0AAV8V3N1_9RHOD|nr:hypothetical protein NDN08_007607 [Rhodosorus marinus]
MKMKTGIVFAMVLLCGAVQAYWATEEPALKCCDIKPSCLYRYSYYVRSQIVKLTGSKLNSGMRRNCSKGGQGHWCVAQHPDTKDWYCMSPGTWIQDPSWHRRCKGKEYPNSGSVRGCEKKICKDEGGSGGTSTYSLDKKCSKKLEEMFC